MFGTKHYLYMPLVVQYPGPRWSFRPHIPLWGQFRSSWDLLSSWTDFQSGNGHSIANSHVHMSFRNISRNFVWGLLMTSHVRWKVIFYNLSSLHSPGKVAVSNGNKANEMKLIIVVWSYVDTPNDVGKENAKWCSDVDDNSDLALGQDHPNPRGQTMSNIEFWVWVIRYMF